MKLNKKVVIVLFICIFILFEIIKITVFAMNISSDKEQHTYKILAKNGVSKSDLKHSSIGYYIEDLISLNYNNKYKYVGYKDIYSLYNALLYGEVGAIIMEDSFITLIEEVEKIDDNIKIIDTYKYSKKISNASKNIDITKQNFIIYISGMDSYGDIKEVSRSDVNILMIVNPVNHKILLISIPRDYYMLMPSKNRKDKLTHIGIYGIDESIKAIEALLDINVDYYIKVNFNSIVDLVDMLGGIDVNSSKTFTSKDGYKYNIGHNKLNGSEVLSFVRERYAFAEGDLMRGFNQEEVIKSLINDMSTTKILLKYNSFLEKLSNKLETNMKESEIISLIKLQIKNKIKWDISTYNLDGENSLEYTYTYPKEKLYVMLPSDEILKTAKMKIKEIGD